MVTQLIFYFVVLAILIWIAFLLKKKIDNYEKPDFQVFKKESYFGYLKFWILVYFFSPKSVFKEEKVVQGFFASLLLLILGIIIVYIVKELIFTSFLL